MKGAGLCLLYQGFYYKEVYYRVSGVYKDIILFKYSLSKNIINDEYA